LHFQKKEKTFKVDDQRFIDFKDMMQKRYDDPTKRRPVKRESDDDDDKVQDKKRKAPAKNVAAENGGKMKIIKKGKCPVDPNADSGLVKNGHVLEEGKLIWSAMLNQTDMGNNNNKFYALQLIEHDTDQKYFVHMRWGRVGAQGTVKKEEYNYKLDAKKSFQKNSMKKRKMFGKKI